MSQKRFRGYDEYAVPPTKRRNRNPSPAQSFSRAMNDHENTFGRGNYCERDRGERNYPSSSSRAMGRGHGGGNNHNHNHNFVKDFGGRENRGRDFRPVKKGGGGGNEHYDPSIDPYQLNWAEQRREKEPKDPFGVRSGGKIREWEEEFDSYGVSRHPLPSSPASSSSSSSSSRGIASSHSSRRHRTGGHQTLSDLSSYDIKGLHRPHSSPKKKSKVPYNHFVSSSSSSSYSSTSYSNSSNSSNPPTSSSSSSSSSSSFSSAVAAFAATTNTAPSSSSLFSSFSSSQNQTYPAPSSSSSSALSMRVPTSSSSQYPPTRSTYTTTTTIQCGNPATGASFGLYRGTGGYGGAFSGGNGGGNSFPSSRDVPVSSGRNEREGRDGRYFQRPTLMDDKGGHLIIVPQAILNNQYEMIETIGQGTFGKVVKCLDLSQRRLVAIKIVRAISKYSESAEIEIDILSEIQKRDPNGSKKCLQLLKHFKEKGHVCMVFPLYGPSLYDYMKRLDYRPFHYTDTWKIARQLLESLKFLHGMNLIHTDLKPENILLVQGDAVSTVNSTNLLKSNEIRMIDFGSATFQHKYHSSLITTRHYRAPEVILGLGWSFPADMWSLGCILFELYTGHTLFQTHDDHQHLAMMQVKLGYFPYHMVTCANSQCQRYFDKRGSVSYPNAEDPLNRSKYQETLKWSNLLKYFPSEHMILYSLISQMLLFDPNIRISPSEALECYFGPDYDLHP